MPELGIPGPRPGRRGSWQLPTTGGPGTSRVTLGGLPQERDRAEGHSPQAPLCADAFHPSVRQRGPIDEVRRELWNQPRRLRGRVHGTAMSRADRSDRRRRPTTPWVAFLHELRSASQLFTVTWRAGPYCRPVCRCYASADLRSVNGEYGRLSFELRTARCKAKRPPGKLTSWLSPWREVGTIAVTLTHSTTRFNCSWFVT